MRSEVGGFLRRAEPHLHFVTLLHGPGYAGHAKSLEERKQVSHVAARSERDSTAKSLGPLRCAL